MKIVIINNKKEIVRPHKNQVTEVLLMLLTMDFITVNQVREDSGIIGLSQRIAELRLKHDLHIPCKEIEHTTKHGNCGDYGSWSVPNKKKGLELYNKLTQ